MKPNIFTILVCLSCIISSTSPSFAQTSWTGTTSTNWSTAANWTAGVPAYGTDVIIGDNNFTGGFQPAINASASAKSITIGTTVVSQLTINNTLTVSGNVSINTNGAINSTADISIYGNLATSGGGTYFQNSGILKMTAPNTTITGENLIFNNVQIDREIITSSSMTISGDLNGGSGFTQTAGTLTMTGTGKTMKGRMAIMDLIITGSVSIDLSGGVNTAQVAGNLTVLPGAAVTVPQGEIGMTGINKTISNEGSLSLSGLLISGNVTTASNFTITGNFTNTGTFMASAGTATFAAGGAQVYFDGAATLNNVLINNTSLYLKKNTALTISNAMTAVSGSLTANWQTPTIVKYNGNNQTVLGANYDSLVLSNGGIKTAGGQISVDKLLTIDQGTTFEAVTYTHKIYGNLVNNGVIVPGTSTIQFDRYNTTLTISGTGIQNFYTLAINGGFVSVDPSVTIIHVAGDLNASGGFTQSTGMLVMSGNSKTMRGRMTLNNVAISGNINIDLSGGVNTAVVAGNVDVNSGSSLTVINGEIWMTGANKTITNTGTLTFSGLKITGTVTTTSDFTITGTLTNTGSFMATNGTARFAAGGAQVYFEGAATLYNILISNTSLFLKLNAELTILNDLTTNSGGLNATWQGPTIVNYNGGDQTVLGTNYHYLNLANGGVKTAGARIIVEKSFTIGAGTTFNASTFSHNINGNWINNGILVPGSSTIALDAPAILMTGTGVQNFYNLTIERYIVTTDATVINVAGNLAGSSGFVQPSGLLTMTGTNKTISGNVAFNNLAITGSITLLNPGQTALTVSGDLMVSAGGSLSAADGKITMTGTDKTITNSGSLALKGLWISGTISTSSDFTIDVSLTTTSNGVFTATAGTTTFTTHAGNRQTYIDGPGLVQLHNIEINNADLILRDVYLKISGDVTKILLGLLRATVHANTTVEYNGPMNQLVVGTDYQCLIVSNAGIKTTAAAISVNKDFLIASPATFNASGFEHTFYSNWINNGFFVGGSSTITFRGSTNTIIAGATTFDKLIIWKGDLSNTVTLTADCITTSIRMDKGKLCTGTYTLAATTVSNAHAANGWIIGQLKKDVATGSNVEKIFELGDANNYLPDTVRFALVNSAGYLTAGIIATQHGGISFSGIDSSKDVNRYWSFVNSGIVFTTATASLRWVAGDVGPGATTASFRACSYNGSYWTLQSTVLPLATFIRCTGLTSFGDFSIGERLSMTTWTGMALTTDWFTPRNWYGHLPDATVGTLVPAVPQAGLIFPVITNGTGTIGSITIEAGASLTLTGGGLQVAGTINNSGTLNAAAGTLEFNGASTQTIPANCFAGNSLQNLLVNNNVVLGGSLAITGTLTISSTNKTLTTDGHLILKSTPLGTARIASLPVDANGAATSFISGAVTVERFIPQQRSWRLVTAPLSNTGNIYNSWQNSGHYQPGIGMLITGPAPCAANGLDPSALNNISMKSYNYTSQAYVNVNNTRSTGLSNCTGSADNVGYFAFIRGDRDPNNTLVPNKNLTTLSATGTIQTGRQIFSASPVLNAFTLVGNPYASPVDFNNVQRMHIRKRFYAWDATINDVGGYVVLDDIDGDGIFSTSDSSSLQNKNIQSGQAVFVETDTAGTAKLIFNENSKSSASSHAGFRPLTGVKSLAIRLNILQPDQTVTRADATLAEFDSSFSNGVNFQDALKFSNVGETFSLQRNGVAIAMERRLPVVANDSLFFKLIQSAKRNYQFVFYASNLQTPNLAAFLQDKYTGLSTPVNLDGRTCINFTIDAAAASAKADRFMVVFKSLEVLPVVFKDITAQQKGKHIAIKWVVENELNVRRYEVEKSTDGSNFSNINSQPATANGGTSSYNWLDEHATAGDNFYRVRNVDADGASTYSKTVSVHREMVASAITLYPNPVVNNTTSLLLNNMPQGWYGIRLFNTVGQLLLTKQIKHAGGDATEKITLPASTVKGMYRLEITVPDKRIIHTSLVKE